MPQRRRAEVIQQREGAEQIQRLAAALLFMYVRRGQPLYLFCALALLYHFGAAALGHRVGKRLFD